MEYTRTKGTVVEAVDVRDLPEEQAQMVQAFTVFLRTQMRAGQKKPATDPCAQWKLCTLCACCRTFIYERC